MIQEAGAGRPGERRRERESESGNLAGESEEKERHPGEAPLSVSGEGERAQEGCLYVRLSMIPRPPRQGVFESGFSRDPTIALRIEAEPRSPTTRREKLVKIGAKVARHGRHVTFQPAEVAVPRNLFRKIPSLIDDPRPRPASA